MSSSFPNGTVFSLYTTLAAADVITAISNANPGVASSTAHGMSDGGIALLSVASARLNNRVVRVAGSVANAWNLEGIDTTSVIKYPTGFGVGSSQLATAPAAISQVTDAQTAGGEQQFYTWQYLESGSQLQRPTFRNAKSLTLVMDWDPDLAWHSALLNASDDGTVLPLLATLPNGNKLYWGMYVSFDGEPSFTINENMKTTAVFALANPLSTRYAS
jgi:hypothetical protein